MAVDGHGRSYRQGGLRTSASEFAAFYGKNVRGYDNICRRLHFFKQVFNRETFAEAVGGDDDVYHQLDDSYLGFLVRRPIPGAPLGRTVLKWYPQRIPERPRISEPRREYVTHVAGLEFSVKGLAWQQQDAAVSTCSTCSIWTPSVRERLAGNESPRVGCRRSAWRRRQNESE